MFYISWNTTFTKDLRDLRFLSSTKVNNKLSIKLLNVEYLTVSFFFQAYNLQNRLTIFGCNGSDKFKNHNK